MNKIFLMILLSILSSATFAAVYYVDISAGDDSNTGLSENQAWKNISKVNSSVFNPGDSILFKRNQTWYETLLVSSSGTYNEPIVYSSYGTGNIPIIDGGMARENGIYIHTKEFVIIEGFGIRNHTGGSIRVMYCQYVQVKGNKIFITGHGGVFVENSISVSVTANSMATPSGFFEAQTDGIYSQKNIDNIYEKNHIVISNYHPVHHVDGIQSFVDEGLTIRDNLIVQDNPKESSQGIYTTSGSGDHMYYNNIIDCPNTVSNVVGFRNLETGSAVLKLYHNTLIGRGGNILSVSGSYRMEAKNNIFVALNSNYSIINIASPVIPGNIDYNLYYNGGNPKIVYYMESSKTLQQWRAMGFDANSIVADPMLNEDYDLTELSPAIDAGLVSGEPYLIDRNNVERPQASGFDLGAHESFYNGDPSSSDPVNIPGRIALQQNYPNPFNPVTQIQFSLSEPAEIDLRVYDILGNEISSLSKGYFTAGDHTVPFDGSGISSGVYLYTLVTGKSVKTRKMILLR